MLGQFKEARDIYLARGKEAAAAGRADDDTMPARGSVPLLPGLRQPARAAGAEDRRADAARLHQRRPAASSSTSIPKVAVGTIIGMPDGRIVLVRRAIEPGHGLWVFPGGYVDRGEDVRLAAVREAREEAGIDIRLDGLVGIYSYPGSTP